jgi:Outer membrane protein beta-barrel domain
MNLRRIAAIVSGLCAFAGLSAAQMDFHHLTFNVGGGFTAVTQGISNRLDHGGNVQGSVGVNITPHIGLQGTFMFNGLGITRSALNTAGEPDGSARVYTFTVDPKISVWSGERASLYVLGGGGWMRRTVEFTRPTLAETTVFDPWFGYFGSALVPANQVLGSFTQDTGVWDVGTGFNFPLPRTSVKLYLEARYFDGMTDGRHTTIVPVTFGLRW